MATVLGLRGTGDWGTDERPKDFLEYIMWRNPNGDTPLTAMMSKMGSKKTRDPEFSWWDEPVDLVRLQVNGTAAAGDTLINVNSPDPSASAPGINWGLAGHLKPGDVLMVEPATSVAETAVFAYEYLEVQQVISDTQFTVKRGAAGSTPAQIDNDWYLLLMGSAYPEGDGEAQAASRNPIKYSNYTQIWKTAYKVTRTASQTFARTGDILQNEKKRKTFDHARARELSYIFGRKSETTGANGEPLRTKEGLCRWVAAQNVTIFGAGTMTTLTFLDAVYKVFDFNSGSGDDRLALVGNLALNALNKEVMQGTGVSMELGSVIKLYGMKLREFILPQGRLLLKTHPLFNRHAIFSASMLLVANSEIKRRILQDTMFQDNIQTKGEDVIKGQWLTEDGLQVDSGGLTQGYIGNVHFTA